MASLTEADYTRISTTAAETFTEAYYTALNASRPTLSTFYLPLSTTSSRPLPHISYNGTLVPSPTDLQTTFVKDMPYTHYEPQSVDAHVLNPVLAVLGEGATKRERERNMSLVVQVSGYVRLFERKEGVMRGFSDSFVLVPNEGVGKDGQGRQWVIQTQNFSTSRPQHLPAATEPRLHNALSVDPALPRHTRLVSDMLITKPKTDQSATFILYANGTPCSEYTLPQHPVDPNAAEVFVAVPPDATLTLSGTISGSLLHCRIDLLADGSFVNNRVVEAGPGDGRQGLLFGRKVEFKNAYTVPHPTVNDRGRRAKVVEGDLIIQPLPAATPHRLLDGRGANLGVGSIALVFSICQVESEKYGKDGEPTYPDHTLGGWRTALEDVRGSGIKPDFSLGLDIYKDANPISDKKANVFWRDYRNTRPGNAPWGTIVFYYRSLEAIERAGCVPMTNGHALAPLVGRFIKAEASPKKSERSAVARIAGSGSSGAQGLLTTPEPAEEAYSVKGKRRRVGQRLPLSCSGVTSGTASPSSPSSVASHPPLETTLLLPGPVQPGTLQNPVVLPAQLPRAPAPNVLSGALFDAFAKISAANSPSASAVLGSPAPSALGKRPSYTSPSASMSQTVPIAPMLPPPPAAYPTPASATSPGILALSVSAQPTSSTSSPAPPPPARRSRLADLQARKAALQAEIAAERERKATVLAAAETARQAREAARSQREAEEREAIQRQEAERVLREREEAEQTRAEEKRVEEERLVREKEEAERERLEEEAIEKELAELKKQAELEREEREIAEAQAEVEELEAQRAEGSGSGTHEQLSVDASRDGFIVDTAPQAAPLGTNGGDENGPGLVAGAVPAADAALDLQLFGPDFGNMSGVEFQFTEEQLAAAGEFEIPMTDEQMAELSKEWDSVVNGLGSGEGKAQE
ncbi:hypothetical protein B0A48_07160 [Cryoendolithus antarcticus]|uniref:NTF2 domain-containing protein n=1 Tax=Cryoendolithus antarcticus TaxID=1507870 RepID=A0A1V8T7S8_9PEZI|nr:hypothetical protein B0A48_07160 [Cryoendolithus antarcticus]